MSFLRLQNIGKIYVSEGNVTVGIRGVNLSFERGEFVAITGASGSGKSTLLNVLSGMDSYEEGELFIEEQPTSHYLQPDWEEYREKYISFIFQNYNILESFTVLQNVELALMTIADPIERRRRAIELIERVGLKKHMRQKGSQLSGGQKQRTVIARALAKDSPIILADEPTGNLDAQTSREIIALLREVSKDKLLIMVTHSYDQVSEFATRHVRVYDGAVEADQMITQPEEKDYTPVEESGHVSMLSNGLLLGRSIFFAKPKLSIFLCLLMLIGTMGIFLMTMFCGDAQKLFEKNHMFRPMEGRLVVIRKDGGAITDEELQGLADKYGAKKSIHYDYLLDRKLGDLRETSEDYMYYYEEDKFHNGIFFITVGENFGTPSIGRYPESETELLLRLPIFYQKIYGKDSLSVTTVELNGLIYTISGIVYIADNSKDMTAVVTEEGYHTLSMIIDGQQNIKAVSVDGSELLLDLDLTFLDITVDTQMDPDKIYYSDPTFLKCLKNGENVSMTLKYENNYSGGNQGYYDVWGDWMYEAYPTRTAGGKKSNTCTFGRDTFTTERPASVSAMYGDNELQGKIICRIGIHVAEKLCGGAVTSDYKQASLFFNSDGKAKRLVDDLGEDGYIAVSSDMTYKSDMGDIIERLFVGFLYAVMWVLSIFFIAMFVNMCTNRTVAAFRDDIAIMRSMGIPAKVIRIGIYVRMLISLVPSLILLPVSAYIIYHNEEWNGRYWYLQPWQYVVLIGGMLYLTIRITRKQIKNLFGTSVKKTLRGGEE